MKRVSFLYGKGSLEYDFCEDELISVLTSSIEEYEPKGSSEELVREALTHPIGTEPLSVLAKTW